MYLYNQQVIANDSSVSFFYMVNNKANRSKSLELVTKISLAGPRKNCTLACWRISENTLATEKKN